MSQVLTASRELPVESLIVFLSSDKFMALSIAILFHVSVLALLLSGWQGHEQIEAKISSVKLQIVMHTPTKVPIEVAPPIQPKPIPKPPVIEPPKLIKKETPKPVIKKAEFAKKRVDKEPTPKVEKRVEKQQKKPVVKEEVAKPVPAAKPLGPPAKVAQPAPVNNKFDASQYFPVEKNPPSYPRRALKKGVQGECTVNYTVNTKGRVESPTALSDCHAYFINASLRATKTFRYTPRIVNGKAVKVLNVKNTFQYRIE
ncbi:MAG: protein TonB [Methylophagaceae bacterium]|jgi:protein TonB